MPEQPDGHDLDSASSDFDSTRHADWREQDFAKQVEIMKASGERFQIVCLLATPERLDAGLCLRFIPEKRARRGSTFCSRECAHDFDRLRRAWRATKQCRLCGRGLPKKGKKTINEVREDAAAINAQLQTGDAVRLPDNSLHTVSETSQRGGVRFAKLEETSKSGVGAPVILNPAAALLEQWACAHNPPCSSVKECEKRCEDRFAGFAKIIEGK